MIANIFVIGLLNGCIYALLAAGFSLMFSVARIVNLAFTAYWMTSAYCYYGLTSSFNLHPLIAAPVSVIAVILISLVFQFTVINPIKGSGMSVMILSLAIGLVLQKIVSMPSLSYTIVPNLIDGKMEWFGVTVTYQYFLCLVVVVVVLLGLWLFLSKTRHGVAIRAISEDRHVAGLMGIDERFVIALVTAVSVGVAAIAGVVVSPLYALEPTMWMSHLLVLMAVVIFGGMGSMKGSIITAFIIAFTETAVVLLVPTGGFLRSAVVMAFMIAVLMIKPTGLFGKLAEE